MCGWLSKKPLRMCLPEHDNATKLANEFAFFFVTKIKLIKEDLNKIHIQEPWLLAVNTVKKLHYFSVFSVEDISKIICESTNAYCEPDPVPTWVLKSCLDVLAPSITEMVNMSLVTGLVSDNSNLENCAWIPLLKKPGLDLVLKNFRPVSNLLSSLRLHFSNVSTTVKIMQLFLKFNPVSVSFTPRKLLCWKFRMISCYIWTIRS